MLVFHQVVFYHTGKNRHVNQTVGKGWRGRRTENGCWTDTIKLPMADLYMHIMSKKHAHRLICLRNERCGWVKGYRHMRLH